MRTPRYFLAHSDIWSSGLGVLSVRAGTDGDVELAIVTAEAVRTRSSYLRGFEAAVGSVEGWLSKSSRQS